MFRPLFYVSALFGVCFYANQLPAANITYYLEGLDGGELFFVFAEIDNSVGQPSTGLATYDIALVGLDAFPALDPATFSWTQNNLQNFNAGFMPQGILVENLIERAVGTDKYQATNSQKEFMNAVYGIGVEKVLITENPIIPCDGCNIDLEVKAWIGWLRISGSNGLGDAELANLLSPTAELFVSNDPSEVVRPDRLFVNVNGYVREVPEPSTAFILLLGLTCLSRRSRRFARWQHTQEILGTEHSVLKSLGISLGMLLAFTAQSNAANITYYFEGPDRNEVFDVFAEIDNSVGQPSTGLATYDIAFVGLDAFSSLDPGTFIWSQNILENFNVAFMPQGILTANLNRKAIGTDKYQATNTQRDFSNAYFGMGLIEIYDFGTPVIPSTNLIFLDPKALIATISLPGSNGLSDAELANLLSPTAELFVSNDPSEVVRPDRLFVNVNGFVREVPEPMSVGLLLVGGVLCTGIRRRQ